MPEVLDRLRPAGGRSEGRAAQAVQRGVESGDLRLPDAEWTVFEYAAPLYRFALTAFLPLTFDVPAPAESDSLAVWGDYNDRRVNFFDPQQIAEKAILTAKPSSVSGEG